MTICADLFKPLLLEDWEGHDLDKLWTDNSKGNSNFLPHNLQALSKYFHRCYECLVFLSVQYADVNKL